MIRNALKASFRVSGYRGLFIAGAVGASVLMIFKAVGADLHIYSKTKYGTPEHLKKK